jgi:hypothetical protein
MPSAEASTFNPLRWPEGCGANQVASSAVGLEPPLGSDSPRAVVARLLGRKCLSGGRANLLVHRGHNFCSGRAEPAPDGLGFQP